MRIDQLRWTEVGGWTGPPSGLGDDAELMLVFGGRSALKDPDRLAHLKELYPAARMLGCSTAGEISGTTVSDETIVATSLAFDRVNARGAAVQITDPSRSHDAGRRVGEELCGDELVHVFVLSNGLHVNGSELVRGLADSLPAHVTVTGGLSGDGARFEETLVVWDGEARPDRVAAVGFYGDGFKVGYGSLGGWDPFGPQRLITRAEGNVLFELDAQPALDLYKRYLGSHADELPASGLLFPLAVLTSEARDPVVRTILAVDEEAGSMTFAGDVPEGAIARLMKANFDRLIDGAAGAAHTCASVLPDCELAILISCVGRKLVLKGRVEEEVEAVREVVGPGAVMTGFYSYGEISPFVSGAPCELHNQTMTITTLAETR